MTQVNPAEIISPSVAFQLETDNISEQGKVQGRLKRAANFLLHLPGQMYTGSQRAAVAFRADPYYYTKRTAQNAVVAAELSFFNEFARYGTLAFALDKTPGGPVIGGLTLGLTTLVVEGSAALTTAELLETDTSNRAITKVNRFIEKHFKRDLKMNPVVEAGVAMLGGSAVVLAEKQRENPARTKAENKRHGKFTAGWMSAYFTVEGAFIGANSSNGDVINARTVGATLIALGATAAGTKFALRGQQTENALNTVSVQTYE